MGKRYRQFIKKLKNESLCTVTPEDIYMQTDFFDNPKPIVYSKKQYKLLLSLSLSIICAFFCLSVMLIINNVKLRNKEPEIVYVENIFYVKVVHKIFFMRFKNFLQNPWVPGVLSIVLSSHIYW